MDSWTVKGQNSNELVTSPFPDDYILPMKKFESFKSLSLQKILKDVKFYMNIRNIFGN